jgi:YceI-like domain
VPVGGGNNPTASGDSSSPDPGDRCGCTAKSPQFEELSPAAIDEQLPTGTWKVDDDVSRVRFEVKHLWGLATVRGEFERVRGMLAVSPDSIDAQFTIDAASSNTRNERRDKHLRSAGFLVAGSAAHAGRRLPGDRSALLGTRAVVHVTVSAWVGTAWA